MRFGIYSLRLKKKSAELIKLYTFVLQSKEELEYHFDNNKKELRMFEDYGALWRSDNRILPQAGFFDHIIKYDEALYLIFPESYLDYKPTLYELDFNKFIKLKIRDQSKIEKFMGKIWNRKREKYFTRSIAEIANEKK